MPNRIIFSGMLLFTAACVTQVLNAQGTLVCQGTRLNGTTFTLPFVPNTNPPPTLGVACVPSGRKMPKGQAVMGTAPKASRVFAVVFVPPSAAGRANTSGAGPAGATLVCRGTRLNGTTFTFSFVPNTSPPPTLGVACVPSGRKMPKGKAVMGTAPKANRVFAVVFVPPSTAGGTPNANQQPNSSPPAANTPGANPPGPPVIANGIAMLQDARQNLQVAGSGWGPHLTNALNYIDQALGVCGVAPPPPPPAGAVGSWANTSLMTKGIQQVTQAQTDFKNAKDPWGGRRDKALPFVTQALQELQAANNLAPGLNTVSNSSNPPGPPMIADGIAMLQDARQNLQVAGTAWGPHLTNALSYIDQALGACGVAPPPPPAGGSNTGSWANTTLMTTGIQQVTQAQTDFKNETDPWGGRRDQALPFITQALQELQAANSLAPGLNTVSNP